MLTLVVLISCASIVVASIVNYRGITTAAKTAAGETIRFDAALIAALAQLEAAQLQHDTATGSGARPRRWRRFGCGRPELIPEVRLPSPT